MEHALRCHQEGLDWIAIYGTWDVVILKRVTQIHGEDADGWLH